MEEKIVKPEDAVVANVVAKALVELMLQELKRQELQVVSSDMVLIHHTTEAAVVAAGTVVEQVEVHKPFQQEIVVVMQMVDQVDQDLYLNKVLLLMYQPIIN